MRNQNRSDLASDNMSLPPQNMEAEESVISSILIDNDMLPGVREILSAENFYRTAHQKIFAAIIDLSDKGEPIDLVTLKNQLEANGQLEIVGGASYLAKIIDTAPMASNARHYANIVRETAVKRLVIEQSNSLAKKCYRNEIGLEGLLADVAEMSSAVMSIAARGSPIQKLDLTIDDLRNHFCAVRETPFPSLNDAIEGLMIGELTIIGGRPGMGKTALALKFLSHTALEESCPVVYCGAQMSKPRIYSRLTAQKCRLPLRKIMGSKISAEADLKKIIRCHEQISVAPIYDLIIKDKISVPALQTMVVNARDKIGQEPGLLIIENLQQLFWPGKEFRNPRDQASFICDKIRPFNFEIKTPIIISSQLNRDVEDRDDKRPMPSDIFGTKGEELSDVIIFPFRPNYYEKNLIEEEGRPERNAELLISKGGPPIVLPFVFWGDYISWEEVE
jgi:replicative DNA helicase